MFSIQKSFRFASIDSILSCVCERKHFDSCLARITIVYFGRCRTNWKLNLNEVMTAIILTIYSRATIQSLFQNTPNEADVSHSHSEEKSSKNHVALIKNHVSHQHFRDFLINCGNCSPFNLVRKNTLNCIFFNSNQCKKLSIKKIHILKIQLSQSI